MGRRGYGEGRGKNIYLTLHCHHQNDSCINMGSDESHFNVSLIVRDKVTSQCPQTTTFEEKGEPKQIWTKVPLLTSLTAYRLAKPAHWNFVPQCLVKGWAVYVTGQYHTSARISGWSTHHAPWRSWLHWWPACWADRPSVWRCCCGGERLSLRWTSKATPSTTWPSSPALWSSRSADTIFYFLFLLTCFLFDYCCCNYWRVDAVMQGLLSWLKIVPT